MQIFNSCRANDSIFSEMPEGKEIHFLFIISNCLPSKNKKVYYWLFKKQSNYFSSLHIVLSELEQQSFQLTHVVILIIAFLGPLGMQISISCRRKFIRLPSILELFRKDVVLTLSHFTRLMTYMPFCIAFTFSLPGPCVSMLIGRVTQRRFSPYIENSYPEFFDL